MVAGSVLEPEDRPKTSFVTHACQKQHMRLPFGFAAPRAIFYKTVNLLLGGMKRFFAIGYIGGIIVRHRDQHLQHLRRLFEAVRKAKLQLHPKVAHSGRQP